MEFYEVTKLIFLAVPEFEKSYNETLDPNYYNSFLGDFGLFITDAIKNGNYVGVNGLIFINDLVNSNVGDKDFLNKVSINILEVLTDYEASQKCAIRYFNGYCLFMFKELLSSGYFNDLTGDI